MWPCHRKRAKRAPFLRVGQKRKLLGLPRATRVHAARTARHSPPLQPCPERSSDAQHRASVRQPRQKRSTPLRGDGPHQQTRAMPRACATGRTRPRSALSGPSSRRRTYARPTRDPLVGYQFPRSPMGSASSHRDRMERCSIPVRPLPVRSFAASMHRTSPVP